MSLSLILSLGSILSQKIVFLSFPRSNSPLNLSRQIIQYNTVRSKCQFWQRLCGANPTSECHRIQQGFKALQPLSHHSAGHFLAGLRFVVP